VRDWELLVPRACELLCFPFERRSGNRSPAKESALMSAHQASRRELMILLFEQLTHSSQPLGL
jgi:hypothetical protein